MSPWLVSLLYKYNYFLVHLEKRKDKIKRQVIPYGGLNFLLRCNYDLKIIERTGMPQCYKAFLQFIHELKSSYETDLGQDLVLFNNKEILTDHKLSFYKEWFGKEIIRVHDFLTKIGTFLSYSEFIITYNLKSSIHKWSQQYPGV